jgi:nucleotide-binding universal stress UspA family protein
MAMFQTIVHPTDFDEPSKQAFRVARSLAQALGARLVVFHVVPPPAIVAQDGRVILDPRNPEPIDRWVEYRRLQAGDDLKVPVEYVFVVGDRSRARHLLEKQVRELGEVALVVMGSHGRHGLSRLIWGSTAEEAVRDCPCPVLVVKASSAKEAACASLPEAIAST